MSDMDHYINVQFFRDRQEQINLMIFQPQKQIRNILISSYPSIKEGKSLNRRHNMYQEFLKTISLQRQILRSHSWLFCLIKMQEQQSEPVFLDNEQQRLLFDMLTNKILYQEKTYSGQDMKVDLVLKLKVPKQVYASKQSQVSFNELFINIPQQYGIVYQMVEQYILYSMESEYQALSLQQGTTRSLTSLQLLEQPQTKVKTVNLDWQVKEELLIDCQYECIPQIDEFTLRYNMILIVLQKICGFAVKTFLFDEEKKGKSIYMLLSQCEQNLLTLADRHKIKKEVDMTGFDFFLNDPVDAHGRPLRLSKQFRQQSFGKELMSGHKAMTRYFGLKYSSLTKDIVQQIAIKPKQINKFLEYSSKVYDQLINIIASDDELLTQEEKQYLYTYNRGKTNDGCINFLQILKKRTIFYDEIIKLNKKFGYSTYQYENCFFEFSKPPKRKAFFDKIAHIMNFKYTQNSPFGELTLFNKMERIKLSYLYLQQYFKVEKFSKAKVEIFAINDNFQKFGDITFEFGSKKRKKSLIGGLNGKRLIDVWHGFIPFLSDVKAIRDYMGQNFAFEILVKIHLINFFAAISPMAACAQIIQQLYFSELSQIYKFSLIYLVFLVVCLTIFQETWKNKENNFFENFVEKSSRVNFRDEYKGPYYRNLITDEVNQYSLQISFFQKIIRFLNFLGLCVLIILEGFIFYGLRMAIIRTYSLLPRINSRYISLPHAIFYGLFFWINFLIYNLAFSKIISKLVERHNYPTKEQHETILRKYVYMFTFSAQLLGPLFLYVIEPFMGHSCYSSECVTQFWNYIYARYLAIFSFILIKIIEAILFYFKGGIKQITNLLDFNSKSKFYETYHDKLNRLLQYVKSEHDKEEVLFDLREQALSLYYYCIYSMSFPFCTVLSFGLLLINYIMDRIYTLRRGRRPIPSSKSIVRLSEIFEIIIHTCIIVNSWAIFFSYQLVQYDLSFLIQDYLTEISQDNILVLKIMLAVISMVLLEIISFIFKRIFSSVSSVELQNRKKKMYEQYIYRSQQTPIIKDQKFHNFPIKTVFRTYNLDALLDYKRNKFHKMKKSQMIEKDRNKKDKLYESKVRYQMAQSRVYERKTSNQEIEDNSFSQIKLKINNTLA